MKLKYLTSLILIISFIAIAVFSLAIFDHQMNHSNRDCLAYTVNGLICPIKIIEISKSLTAPVSNLLLMSVFSVFIPILLFLLFLNWLPPKLNSSYSQRRFIHWLSLLEHSPSF